MGFEYDDFANNLALEEYSDKNDKSLDPTNIDKYPWVIPNYFQRTRRGIYDECCRNPCTLLTLATYCRM